MDNTLLAQDSVDEPETVDSTIQHPQEPDDFYRRFSHVQNTNYAAGSLLQHNELVRILQLSPSNRAPADILMLADMMSKTSFAAGMPRGLLEAVATNVKLVSCLKGATIMKEGGAGDHMYIIANGSCTVIKADKKGKNRALRSLAVGQSFGELALQESHGRRAATVTAAEDCDLLAVNGFVYREVLAQHDRQQLDRRVELLMRLPVFKGLSPRALQDVAQIMEHRAYPFGSFIFRQGDEAESLFVLVSGSVRIVRQMTVPVAFAAQHSTDLVTHQVLDPTLRVEERFQPIPERAIRYGRPRSYLLPKVKDQMQQLQPGQLSNRPKSAGAVLSGDPPSRPSSSPRLRAALKALRQTKISAAAPPMHGDYEDDRKSPPPTPPPWAVSGRPPWNAGRGFKSDNMDSTSPGSARSGLKPPLQRPKTAQARFCIVTKGRAKPTKALPTCRSLENVPSALEQHTTLSMPTHHRSASPQRDSLGGVLNTATSGQQGGMGSLPNSGAEPGLRKRPSTARASIPTQPAAPSDITQDAAAATSQPQESRNRAASRIQVQDPRKRQVPGLELAGVTAEQLDNAGMLYTDEQCLLEASKRGSAHTKLAPLRNCATRKPPSGRSQKVSRSKEASTVAVQEAAGQRNFAGESDMCKAWIELCKLAGPDYFGEAAMLGRGIRHATVVTDSKVEILALTKVDFDLKIRSEARDMVGILVSKYPKDNAILKSMAQEAKWELYKRELVQQVLVDGGKADRLRWYSSQLFSKAWKP